MNTTSEKTKEKYIANIGVLRNNYNIYDLEDYEYVLEKINKLSKNTIKIFCNSIIYWNTYIKKSLKNGEYKEINENIMNKYRNKIKEISVFNKAVEESSKKTERYENILSWKDIVAIRNDMIKKNIHSLETCIISIFTCIPPRRILDYARMYYIDNEHCDTFVENKNLNYCVHKNNNIIFIINRFKMAHKMSSIVYSVNDLLKNIILGYVHHNNIKNNDLLLGYTQETNLSTALKKIFDKYTDDNGGSVMWLRHAYSTYIYLNPVSFPIVLRKKISLLMGHSYYQNQLYSYQSSSTYDHDIAFDKEIIKSINDINIYKKYE